MEDSPILVVAAAIATYAALLRAYTNYNRWRRDHPKVADNQKVDMMESSEPCKQDEDTQLLHSEGLHTEDFCIASSESYNEFERIGKSVYYEKGHDSDAKNAKQHEFQQSVLAWKEISTNEVQAGFALAYSPANSGMLETNRFTDVAFSPAIADEVKTVTSDDFAVIPPALLSEKEEGAVVSSCLVMPAEKKRSELNQNSYELGHITTKDRESLMSRYDEGLKASAEEVSDCNEGEQPGVRPSSHVKNFSAKTLNLTSQSDNLKTALGGTDILPKGTLTSEAQTLIGFLKEGLVSKDDESMKMQRFTRNIGRTLMDRHTNGTSSNFPRHNGFAREANSPTAYVKSYNRLLADGRLKDCVELLEKMEIKGFLDMDKVHHTKFLKACRSQRAVTEAFKFCKLILKPTLSTFNMLLSVCASSQNFDGAFQAMLLVKEAGLKPDCKLYTTLISTCAKSGEVDAMFEIFHEMVNAGVEPNVNTYGALIDGCARAGQVAKAFGAYGIMRSKKVQPDRVIFNALITACGQSGAVDRAFDVLAEMGTEPKPIDPDHVTVGALMKTCVQAGQVDRVREVYKMLHKYNIKGTPEVYTIAVNSCSQTGDLEFALSIYSDMKKNGVVPDEMFLSTIIDVAGHSGNIDTAFEILQDARSKGIRLGNVSYSSLMGACCNAKNWQKALELYEEIKAIKLLPTASTLNALVTSLCEGEQLLKSIEVLDEMKKTGVQPNTITYSVLIVACEKKDEAELGFTLLSKAKEDGILPNLIMCRCLAGLCLKSLEKAYSLGESVVTFNSGKPQIDSKWTSRAIMVYRETISASVIPTIEVFSQVLGCLRFPHDSSLRNRFIGNLDVHVDASKCSNICSLLDGFGEYDTRCFSVLEEAASLGVIQHVSFKDSPIVVDARKLLIHTVEVYLLTILKGLKHRLAAGARLPNITILLPVEKTQAKTANGKGSTISISGRVGQAVGSLLRRLGLRYSGDESFGKIRINGLALRRWFNPKISGFSTSRPGELIPTSTRLGKGIFDQQRDIRSANNLSLE